MLLCCLNLSMQSRTMAQRNAAFVLIVYLLLSTQLASAFRMRDQNQAASIKKKSAMRHVDYGALPLPPQPSQHSGQATPPETTPVVQHASPQKKNSQLLTLSQPPAPPNGDRDNSLDFLAVTLVNETQRRSTAALAPDRTGPHYQQRGVMAQADPVALCANGYELVGDKCTREEYSSAKLGCNEGWRLVDSTCHGMEVMTPRYRCPEGFHEHETFCIKDIVAPHFAECPNGFVLTAAKTCLRETKAEAVPRCAGDGERVSSEDPTRCIRELALPPLRSCPPDFLLDNDGQCQKQQIAPARRICPPGFHETEEFGCSGIMRVPATPQCPPEYTLEYGACRRTIQLVSPSLCPSNSIRRTDDGNCVLEEVIPSLKRCTDGFQLQPGNTGNTVCAGYEVHDVVPVCPKGFFLEGTYCVRQVGKGPRKLAGHSCPPGTEYSPVLMACQSVRFVPPEVTCPPGAILKNDSDCYREQIVPAFPSPCEDPTCQTTHEEPVILGCPSSFLLVKDQCERQATAPGETHCDLPGYTINENGECIRLEFVEPDVRCPSDLKLVRGLCVGERHSNSYYECPEGFVPMHNLKGGTVRYCEAKEIVRPLLKCPPDYVEDGSQCKKRVTAKAIAVCDKEFDIVLDQCVKDVQQSPVVMCPVGTRFRGEKTVDILALGKANSLCSNTVRMAPTYACPPSFKLGPDGRTCLRPATPVGVPTVPSNPVLPPFSIEPAVAQPVLVQPISVTQLSSSTYASGTSDSIQMKSHNSVLPPQRTATQQTAPIIRQQQQIASPWQNLMDSSQYHQSDSWQQRSPRLNVPGDNQQQQLSLSPQTLAAAKLALAAARRKHPTTETSIQAPRGSATRSSGPSRG